MCERIKGILKNLFVKGAGSYPEELNYQIEVDDQEAMLNAAEGETGNFKNTVKNSPDIGKNPLEH